MNRASLKTLASFGGVVQILGFLAIVLNSIERAISVPLVGLQAAGLLDISTKLPYMGMSVPSAFASSLVPAASYLQAGASTQHESLSKLYIKGARYMNLSASYIYGLLATAPALLLWVWLGKRYTGTAYLMLVFTLATQVHLMTAPGTSILKGIGRPYEEFWYALPNVGVLFVTVPLSRVILGRWSVIGIGTAVAGATIISAAFFIWHANRRVGLRQTDYLRRVALPSLVPYTVGLLLVLPIVPWASGLGRWTAAAVVLALGIIYTAVVALADFRFVLDEGERLWFLAVLRARLGKVLHR